jgi:hypothetical protein
MVVHLAHTPWQVLPAVANGMGSREQDFPAPTTRVGSPTFITKTGQEPNLGLLAVIVGPSLSVLAPNMSRKHPLFAGPRVTVW